MKGTILNEIYQIQAQLSKRGGRETFLAKNLDTKELVVVKLLKFGLDAAWEDFKLFEREAKTLKNIDHPAIPSYLDYFELNLPNCQGFALVQQYIAAPSLETAIKTGRTFSELEIKELAEVLLNILQYLHQRQPSIIHRDIKPSNILLTDRTGNSVGQVYLIDFGAVKNVAATEGGTITVVGTYGYMPPEQFGGRITPASDIYSLGATLIYLATRRHPTNLPSKDGRIIFAELVNLSSFLIKWLNQMTELSCDLRFNSATAALQALKQPITCNKNSAIIKQPAHSKIKLHKTSAEIDVLIPSIGFIPELIYPIALAIGLNSFLVEWIGMALFRGSFPSNLFFGLFSLPLWTVGLSLIGKILFTVFGSTRLKITSEQVSLAYECLNIKYQRPKPISRHSITAIDRISSESAVTIWAEGKPYKLYNKYAEKLSEIELGWLTQELSEWLNIAVTKR